MYTIYKLDGLDIRSILKRFVQLHTEGPKMKRLLLLIAISVIFSSCAPLERLDDRMTCTGDHHTDVITCTMRPVSTGMSCTGGRDIETVCVEEFGSDASGHDRGGGGVGL